MWERDHEQAFLSLVKAKDIVWSIKHPDHNNQAIKGIAFEHICQDLRKLFPELTDFFTVPETMRKWKHLRGYKLRVEREKLQKKCGAAGAGLYKRWANDAAMDFLLDNIKADQSTSNLSQHFTQPDTTEDKADQLNPKEVVRKWTSLCTYNKKLERKLTQEKSVSQAKVWEREKEMNFLLDTTPGTSKSSLSSNWAPPESPSPISSQRSMHSSVHSQHLLKAVAGLFSKSRYSDTTIVCEGQLFPAHKMVLAASSGYFNEIFSLLPDKSSVIVLKDISSDIFNDILLFIYCGEVLIEQSKLENFLNAANSLKVMGIPSFNSCHNDTAKNVADKREECGSEQNILSDGSFLDNALTKKAYTPIDYNDVAKNVPLEREGCGNKRKIPSGSSALESAPSKRAYTHFDDVDTPTANKYQPQVSENQPKTEFPQITLEESETQQICKSSVASSADRPRSGIKNNEDNGSLANVIEECWIKEEFVCEHHPLEALEEISCSSCKAFQSEEDEVSASFVSATAGVEENTSIIIQPMTTENEFCRNVAIDENIVDRRVTLLAKKIVLPNSYCTYPATDGESSSTGKKNVSKSPISPAVAHGFEYDIIDSITKNDLLSLSKPHFRPVTDSVGNILCPVCHSKLLDMHHYKRHMDYHTVSRMFTCRHCDFCTFKEEDAVTHVAAHRSLPLQ